MRLTVLGSGSRGNAILVDTGTTRVLVDIGFGPRTIAARLRATGHAPESVTAVLLTHEHVDHAGGALEACARWGWPLHATADTLSALPTPLVPDRTFVHGQPWSVGDVTVCSVGVPHDAADCTALVLEDRATGFRAGVALDLGHVPDALPAHFARLDALIVEANHDEAMLWAGPYPRPLKQRIGGDRGHLSNAAAATLVAACAHPGLRAVILAHLSETNNTPRLASETVRHALRRLGRAGATARERVWTASQRTPLGPVTAGGRRGLALAEQMDLGL